MRLAVNIDHVATLRNARGGTEPDPVEAALVAEAAGASCIVCHLREDRRHVRDADLRRLRAEIGTRLDLEMAATAEIIRIARKIRPELATLVPERRRELTTEGGLDVEKNRRRIRDAVEALHGKDIAVSLFVDPLPAQIEASREAGADMIEIHTGEYAIAATAAKRKKKLHAIRDSARLARSLGLGVNAGHGLDFNNIIPVAGIVEIEEVSIGHALIARALESGMKNAVREMIGLIRKGRKAVRG
jgi:pyridoxine 5-phosphate synthase